MRWGTGEDGGLRRSLYRSHWIVNRYVVAVVLNHVDADFDVSGVGAGVGPEGTAHSRLTPVDLSGKHLLGVAGLFPALSCTRPNVLRGQGLSVGKIAIHVTEA